MLLLAAVLLAAPTAAVTTPDAPAASSPTCPSTARYYAWQRGKSVAPQKLTELPPANVYYTVYRRIGGCMIPVIVRFGVGGR